jgi:hypothetical protein
MGRSSPASWCKPCPNAAPPPILIAPPTALVTLPSRVSVCAARISPSPLAAVALRSMPPKHQAAFRIASAPPRMKPKLVTDSWGSTLEGEAADWPSTSGSVGECHGRRYSAGRGSSLFLGRSRLTGPMAGREGLARTTLLLLAVLPLVSGA